MMDVAPTANALTRSVFSSSSGAGAPTRAVRARAHRGAAVTLTERSPPPPRAPLDDWRTRAPLLPLSAASIWGMREAPRSTRTWHARRDARAVCASRNSLTPSSPSLSLSSGPTIVRACPRAPYPRPHLAPSTPPTGPSRALSRTAARLLRRPLLVVVGVHARSAAPMPVAPSPPPPTPPSLIRRGSHRAASRRWGQSRWR